MHPIQRISLRLVFPAFACFATASSLSRPGEMKDDSGISVHKDLVGYQDRKNTVAHLPPNAESHGTLSLGRHAIFFPGDIQDFEEEMQEHHSAKQWADWSYEKVIGILSEKFSGCHIWLIVPSRKMYKIFSIYKNFVKSNSLFGVPEHDNEHGGLVHLVSLFQNALSKCGTLQDAGAQNTSITDPVEPKGLNSNEVSEIIIIGFSKGCIVLNQLLHEIAHYTKNPEPSPSTPEYSNVSDFVNRITRLYWLDGGHSGQKDVWVRKKEVLSCLKQGLWRNDLKIFVHVTPYQVKDVIHPWKGEEEAEFVAGLAEVGVDYVEKLHFDDEVSDDGNASENPPDKDADIKNHFEILRAF